VHAVRVCGACVRAVRVVRCAWCGVCVWCVRACESACVRACGWWYVWVGGCGVGRSRLSTSACVRPYPCAFLQQQQNGRGRVFACASNYLCQRQTTRGSLDNSLQFDPAPRPDEPTEAPSARKTPGEQLFLSCARARACATTACHARALVRQRLCCLAALLTANQHRFAIFPRVLINALLTTDKCTSHPPTLQITSCSRT
jgi:hypothetical protein